MSTYYPQIILYASTLFDNNANISGYKLRPKTTSKPCTFKELNGLRKRNIRLNGHEHWHTDVSYINLCGTFYYLCGVLDGFSRYIVHWEIRESMTTRDIEIILQRAKELFPQARPRIISDNGPQFISRDFKEFIRISGMTHVRTSPYYPQSNGKIERWHQSLKVEGIRPRTPLSLEDARRIVDGFVREYNEVRLHGGIDYLTPRDKLEGRAERILAERDRKLAAARDLRKYKRASLTTSAPAVTMPLTGETEADVAGTPSARDNPLELRRYVERAAADNCRGSLPDIPEMFPMPYENPDGAQPRRLSLMEEVEVSSSR